MHVKVEIFHFHDLINFGLVRCLALMFLFCLFRVMVST